MPRASVVGLLGPNGAGTTTFVKVLTMLSRPDEGQAHIDGFDVVTSANDVRRRIGLAGQQATVDELLTGGANLELIGRLYHLRRASSRTADPVPGRANVRVRPA